MQRTSGGRQDGYIGRSLRRMLVAAVAMAPAMAGAEIYRWADASGNVTYSNQPPASQDVRYRKVQVAVPQARGTGRPAREERSDPDLDRRVDALEKQLERERQARFEAETRAALVEAAHVRQSGGAGGNGYAGVIPVASGPIWFSQWPGQRHGGHHPDRDAPDRHGRGAVPERPQPQLRVR